MSTYRLGFTIIVLHSQCQYVLTQTHMHKNDVLWLVMIMYYLPIVYAYWLKISNKLFYFLT